MKRLQHISKLLSCSFILLLLWSITPTHLLHEIFATHHDAYMHVPNGHEENLNSFTYQCDTKTPVLKTGFVVAESISLPTVPIVYWAENSPKFSSPLIKQTRLLKGLRAPPVFS